MKKGYEKEKRRQGSRDGSGLRKIVKRLSCGTNTEANLGRKGVWGEG